MVNVASMTKAEKAAYRLVKLKEIREYNKNLIEDLGIPIDDFNIKYVFTRNGVLVVGIFPNEFNREKGFYFELIDSDIEPNDDNRTVYRLAPTEFYEDEYEMDEYGKFLVPIEELRIINRQSVAISKSSAATSSDAVLEKEKVVRVKPTGNIPVKQPFTKNPLPEFTLPAPTPIPAAKPAKPAPALIEDAPYSEMTIRDYFAIHSGLPVSTKPWLNELVKRK